MHASPGRIRVRVRQEDRRPEHMELLREQLSHDPNVDLAEVNARSGSVLVLGGQTDQLRQALENVLDVVQKAGPEGLPELGVDAVVDTVKQVDDRLARVTNGRVSLRVLVPATFIAVGLRQLLRQGLSAGAIPWYVLFYYGVDSFLKLYPEHAPRHPDAAQGGPP